MRTRRDPVMRPLCTLAILSAALGLVACTAAPPLYQRVTDKPFQEVLEDAEFAVTERNFRVTASLHIGSAIRERGAAEFPDVDVILFCNLNYARRMLELRPEFVNHCPGRITLRAQDGKTHIGATLLPERTGDAALDALMRELNGIIRAMVDYAVEDWSENLP